MSTRAQVRFATREEGVSFNEHPEKIHAQFYKHSDGYPEGLGLDIAMSIMNTEPINGWEIEPLTHKHGDLYTGRKGEDKCVFVGLPTQLITKYGSQEDESYYKLNTNNDG